MVVRRTFLFFSLFLLVTEAFLSKPRNKELTRVQHNGNFCLSSLNAKLTTLTDETNWDLRFLLKGLPTENGKKVDEIFSVSAQFIEEEGYEPPQGYVRQLGTEVGSDSGEEEASRLKIVNSRWLLSEDPSERKDGLWVWGLFKEPLYPFLLLQLEIDRIPVPGEDNDAIKPLKLYAQLNHKREKETGVILSGADIKVRELEQVKADPFGATYVDLYEEVTVGNLQVQPGSQ